MSTLYEVKGIINPDVLLDKMLDLRRAYDALGMDHPIVLRDYFGEYAGGSDEDLWRQKTEVNLEYTVEEVKVDDINELHYIIEVKDIPKKVIAVHFRIVCDVTVS